MQRGIPESGEQGEKQGTQEGGQALAQVPVPRVAPVVYSWNVKFSSQSFILPIYHRVSQDNVRSIFYFPDLDPLVMNTEQWHFYTDPDPAIFVIDFQEANKKQFFLRFSANYLLFEGTCTSFFKDKKS